MINEDIKRIVDMLEPFGFRVPEIIQWRGSPTGGWAMEAVDGEWFYVSPHGVANVIIGEAVLRWVQKFKPELKTNLHGDWYTTIGRQLWDRPTGHVHWDGHPMDSVLLAAQQAAVKGFFKKD